MPQSRKYVTLHDNDTSDQLNKNDKVVRHLTGMLISSIINLPKITDYIMSTSRRLGEQKTIERVIAITCRPKWLDSILCEFEPHVTGNPVQSLP